MALTKHNESDDFVAVDRPDGTRSEKTKDSAAAPSAPARSELDATEKEQHEKSPPEIPSSQVGAGLLFGLLGLVLGGPLLALCAGTGAAVVANPKNESKVGEAARASGEYVIEAGEKVGAKAKEVDERHHVSEKTKEGLAKGWTKVKEFDEGHHVSENIKQAASDVGARTREFEEKHHYVEKFLGGVKRGVDFLMAKLGGCTGNESCGGGSTAPKA